MTRIGELIRKHNAALPPGEPRLTQRRLAELAGTTEAVVSRHVRGRAKPTVSSAQRYAAVLGCRPEEILFDVVDLPTLANDRAA